MGSDMVQWWMAMGVNLAAFGGLAAGCLLVGTGRMPLKVPARKDTPEEVDRRRKVFFWAGVAAAVVCVGRVIGLVGQLLGG